MAAIKSTTKAPRKKSVPRTTTTSISTVPRRRGRPSVNENGLLDRSLIIACAFQLSRDTPLQELSIVRVARELGVTPALIHYYIDGRDALTSGVMNSFYRKTLEAWPALTGHWQEDVENVVRAVYAAYVSYPGIAAYVVAHNRYRLSQLLIEGETNHATIFFERFVAVVRAAGVDSYRTAMWSHLLMEFVVSMAFSAVRHRFPGEHGDHLDRLFSALPPDEFPNMCFVHKDFVRLNAGEAFAEALRLMLTTIGLERSGKPRGTKPAVSR